MMTTKTSCHIGTSGWHYPHWKGPFYPDGYPERDFLSFYAERFDTVEINNSFYQLPAADTLDQWRRTVGSGFVFAVKASRYITHMKKLKEPEKTLSSFWEATDRLKDRLGPVLFQLPPRWHCNPDRLAAFLAMLPRRQRAVFEFRDKSWFNDAVYALLSEANAACCIYDMQGETTPDVVTADFVYVRFHGPRPTASEGGYSRQQLRRWADMCRHWLDAGKDLYVYFNNDAQGFAVENADTLRQMLKA